MKTLKPETWKPETELKLEMNLKVEIDTMKKETWKMVIQIPVSILTAMENSIKHRIKVLAITPDYSRPLPRGSKHVWDMDRFK